MDRPELRCFGNGNEWEGMTVKRLLVGLIVAMISTAAMIAATETCFYKRESVDGTNKICYYSCLSGDAAITVKNFQFCPLNIKR